MNDIYEPVDEFGAWLVELAGAYGTKLTAVRARIYRDALGHLDIATLRRAGTSAIQESKYFPTVAEILSQAQGTTDDAAVLAWAGLIRSVEVVGAWTALEVRDPYASEALAVVFGTWPSFCDQADDGPALTQRRQEFLAAYRQARRVRATGITPRRFAGLASSSDSASTANVIVGVLPIAGEPLVVPEQEARLLTSGYVSRKALTRGD